MEAPAGQSFAAVTRISDDGGPFEEIDRAEALAWLAHEYLRAFGPASVADLAWWSGATRREAAQALLHARTVERDGLLLLVEDVDAFEHIEPLEAERLDILPKWDSLTMGYAPDGRQRFIEDRYLSLAYTSVTGSRAPPAATACHSSSAVGAPSRRGPTGSRGTT